MGEQGDGDNQFKLISDLTFGPEGDLYVTDKLKAKIFTSIPRGISSGRSASWATTSTSWCGPRASRVDRDNRIWVIDAGVSLSPSAWSTEVAKIYDQQGRLLLFFGRPGNEPGNMNLPAKIILDYDHVDLFRHVRRQGGQDRVPGVRVEPVRPGQSQRLRLRRISRSRQTQRGDADAAGGEEPAAGIGPSCWSRPSTAAAPEPGQPTGRCPAIAADQDDRRSLLTRAWTSIVPVGSKRPGRGS